MEALSDVDDYSPDGTGWARFSPNRVYRYRLGRMITTRALKVGWQQLRQDHHLSDMRLGGDVLRRVVFLMLNPSTADAFKLDPTVARCAKFAARWGADILEVVNLFAFRSSNPADLRAELKAGRDPRGASNDDAILEACLGAERVIAAWGSGGAIADRGPAVLTMLGNNGVALHCLARVPSDGSPMHPLSRGKLRIPDEQEPMPWLPW